jgi:hypothetical protein
VEPLYGLVGQVWSKCGLSCRAAGQSPYNYGPASSCQTHKTSIWEDSVMRT